MDDKDDKNKLLFQLSQLGYLILFIGVCTSIWIDISILKIINGVFFVIYFLNLWHAGIKTDTFYDDNLFIVDALNIAAGLSLIAAFIQKVDDREFVIRCLGALFFIELLAMIWDRICHGVANGDDGKKFLDKWSILTGIGLIILAVALTLLISSSNCNKNQVFISDIISLLWQVFMLIYWNYDLYKANK